MGASLSDRFRLTPCDAASTIFGVFVLRLGLGFCGKLVLTLESTMAVCAVPSDKVREDVPETSWTSNSCCEFSTEEEFVPLVAVLILLLWLLAMFELLTELMDVLTGIVGLGTDPAFTLTPTGTNRLWMDELIELTLLPFIPAPGGNVRRLVTFLGFVLIGLPSVPINLLESSKDVVEPTEFETSRGPVPPPKLQCFSSSSPSFSTLIPCDCMKSCW